MNQHELDGVNARIAAVSMTLSAVISALGAEAAAQAREELAMSRANERANDEHVGNSKTYTANRDALVEAFLDLLQVTARR